MHVKIIQLTTEGLIDLFCFRAALFAETLEDTFLEQTIETVLLLLTFREYVINCTAQVPYLFIPDMIPQIYDNMGRRL